MFSKFKLIATAMLLVGMLATGTTAEAGVLSGMGERPVPCSTEFYFKTTSDRCSDLTLGDISIYDRILACTVSEISGASYSQSTPMTTCYENSSTYLGQYVSIVPDVGQQIKLEAYPREGASVSYTAEFLSWDYH